MTRVKCTVDSCEFWGEGNICKADVIWVKKNMGSDADEEMVYALGTEFAEEPEVYLEDYEDVKKDMEGLSPAETSSQTLCDTMRPKKR